MRSFGTMANLMHVSIFFFTFSTRFDDARPTPRIKHAAATVATRAVRANATGKRRIARHSCVWCPVYRYGQPCARGLALCAAYSSVHTRRAPLHRMQHDPTDSLPCRAQPRTRTLAAARSSYSPTPAHLSGISLRRTRCSTPHARTTPFVHITRTPTRVF